MTRDLLQDLWLHQTTDVAVSAVTIDANHVTVHAATTRLMPRGGRAAGRSWRGRTSGV
ncbi:hypothetical protein ACFC8N_48150 [Streptomyces sp. NPDC055966]|uniref:hypothetical protein n=1 Tax=unclassified Streptomyces TaxID=2593676 RepID=UPI0035DE6387